MSRRPDSDQKEVILCVDDDVVLFRLIRRLFARRGHAVAHAVDPAAGLARVKRGGVAAVILDHNLGGSVGMDFLRAVKDLPNSPPVVYVTASSELSIAVEALKAGAMDFVVKSLGPNFEVELLAALEQSLESARRLREKERAESEVREERDRAMALLDEVNHRVANSLALVMSLVRMQAAAVPEASARSVLAETQARIAAIANLHRSLYASEDVRTVDLANYLHALVEELRQTIAAASQTTVLSVDAANARIGTDKAVAIGVIVTELITNAVKYAYPEGAGEVRLRFERNPRGGFILAVEDDGVGFAGSADKGAGLGGRIVGAMARSLGAELEYGTPKTGARVFLRLDPDLFIDPPPA
jgi:two-component sensor histidine kinase